VTDGNDNADLATAYRQRDQQLYETRGALGEAVSTLTAELRAKREELASLQAERERLMADNQALRDEVHRLTASLQQLHRDAAALEAALTAARARVARLDNMKLVRWTRPIRRTLDRLRKTGR
jgi:chromosome segregation ATPase